MIHTRILLIPAEDVLMEGYAAAASASALVVLRTARGNVQYQPLATVVRRTEYVVTVDASVLKVPRNAMINA